ncbi:MAG: hypothetical protein LBR66_07735 [Candidatus Symbiothrix sp.]|jgi:hypothetical protein|nr:hypothetical protein [Candidatus Symbiothrix sp.]
MGKNKDVFDKFQKSLNHLSEKNVRVLETNVPVETQMEYFRFSEHVRKIKDISAVDEQIEVLHSPDVLPEAKQYAMTALAISGEVKAFRALEAYANEVEPELSDWLAMAVLQARITLESEFSDEKRVFISTGLGGKGNRLRFYALFQSEDLEPFSDYQRTLIEKEIPFQVQKYNGEVEEIDVADNYFSIVFLISLHEDIKTMLQNAIAECNEYGQFISTSFIVTNIKRFDKREIELEFSKNRKLNG